MGGRTSIGLAQRALLIVVIFLLASAPSALAGADVEAGPVAIVVHDDKDDQCAPDLAGVCLVDAQHDGTVGGTEVNARQDVRYAGVAIDLPERTAHVAVFDLLPGGGLVFDGQAMVLRHPFIRLTTEALQNLSSPAPYAFQFDGDTQQFAFYHLRPDPTDPQQPLERRRWALNWQNESDIGYEHVGPFPEFFKRDTDHYAAQVLVEGPCHVQPGSLCSRMQQTHGAWSNATPNVVVGLSVGKAQVATDPSQLQFGTGARDAAYAETLPLPREGYSEPVRRESPEAAEPPVLERQGAASPSAPGDAGTRPPPEQDPLGVETQALRPPLPSTAPVWVIVAATATAAALLAALVAFALYSRITSKPQALQHPMRALILDLVRQTPATSPTELAPLVGLTRNAVVHHVRMLRRAGLVRVEQREGRTFLFATAQSTATGTPTPAAPAVLCRLVGEDPLLDALLQAPDGLTRPEIHKQLADLPKRTRNHRLRRLLERGLLAEEGTGRGARYLVQPDVREHLLQNAEPRS